MNSTDFLHRRLTDVASRCLGIDISAEAIDAMKSVGMDNVACADACALPDDFDAKFDVIIAGEVIEHLPNPGTFMAQSARCLRSGGALVVTVPNAFNILRLWGVLRGREMVHRDHCYYFSAKTGARLASLYGFQLGEVAYTDPLALAREHFVITPIWRFLINRFPAFGQSLVCTFTLGESADARHLIIN
jgi:SAM-dependent methyltransferase